MARLNSEPLQTSDTDASSVYEADGMKIQSLTDFNLKILKEGEEVRKLLDLALSEKKETEKVRPWHFLWIVEYKFMVSLSILTG